MTYPTKQNPFLTASMVIKAVAEETGTPLIDLTAVFARICPSGIAPRPCSRTGTRRRPAIGSWPRRSWSGWLPGHKIDIAVDFISGGGLHYGHAPSAPRGPAAGPPHGSPPEPAPHPGCGAAPDGRAGPEALTVSSVARAAGLNRTTAYQHFRTRDELVGRGDGPS